MSDHLGAPLPASLDQTAETLRGIGCVASAKVVDKLAATARATQFRCSTAPPAPTRDERCQELDQIRSEIGGGRRIVCIYDKDIYRHDKAPFISGSFVQAMIDQILNREFPADLH